jgi:protein O-mannosyl-transferase
MDDPAYVTGNRQVQQGLTSSSLRWALSVGPAANWHPLTWLSHMVDCQLYGLNPAGHHLTSILLHATNAVLLFLCLTRMTGALWRSAVTAALFAWHPLRVESVAWVAERKDVLSVFFGLLALWAYAGYVEQPGLKRYALVALALALGLASKSMLVTLPVVLLLLDYWPLERLRAGAGRLVAEKVPLFSWRLCRAH